MIDAWQDSEYFSGSKYGRGLNAWVTQGSGQNTRLQMFDMFLIIPLVLKWQGYRKFCVNCRELQRFKLQCQLQSIQILEYTVENSRDSGYSEYAVGSQYTKILNVSGISIYQSFIEYTDRVPNIPQVLDMLQCSESVLKRTLK